MPTPEEIARRIREAHLPLPPPPIRDATEEVVRRLPRLTVPRPVMGRAQDYGLGDLMRLFRTGVLPVIAGGAHQVLRHLMRRGRP